MDNSALLAREAALRAENEMLNKNLDEMGQLNPGDTSAEKPIQNVKARVTSQLSEDSLLPKPFVRRDIPSKQSQPVSRIPRPVSQTSKPRSPNVLIPENDPSRKLDFENEFNSNFDDNSSPISEKLFGTDSHGSEIITPRISYTSPEAIEASIDREINPNLPLEIQVRMLRSSLKMARLDVVSSANIADDLQIQLRQQNKDSASIVEERNRLARTVAQAEKALQKAKDAAATASARELELRTQLSSYQRDAKQRDRSNQAPQPNASVDARVSRLQEERDKIEEQLRKERAHFEDMIEEKKAEISTLHSTQKRLERQKQGVSFFLHNSVLFLIYI